LYAVERFLYRYKNKLIYRKRKKKKEKREGTSDCCMSAAELFFV
jgi:hypothetical protein